MRLAFFSLFLTLVVLSANAAPDSSLQPDPIRTEETFQKTDSGTKKDSVQATEAPAYNPLYIRKARAYADGSINVGVGSGVGAFDTDKETKDVTTFHLQRTQYNADDTAQEFGLSLTSIHLIGLDWGFKKFCCFNSFASEWKPYLKIGAAAFYEPKDQLATLIDYQRYFWQAGAGLENLFSLHRSVRAEIGARAGYPGTHFYLQIFYAFPD